MDTSDVERKDIVEKDIVEAWGTSKFFTLCFIQWTFASDFLIDRSVKKKKKKCTSLKNR